MTEHYDLIVVGAGSGGIGAALAAARKGLSVLLMEKADSIGGTAVRGGVHVWEPGVGGTGIPFEIYKRLREIPDAVGLYTFGRPLSTSIPNQPAFPGGEQLIDPSLDYSDSLRRYGAGPHCEDKAFVFEHWHGVVFEPEAYVRIVKDMLAETGCCRLLTNTIFTSVRAEQKRILSATLDNGETVEAETWIDATGDAVLCRKCGCEVMFGQDPRSRFNEPDAPEQANDCINGVSLVFRATSTDREVIEPLPSSIPPECWWRQCFPSVAVTHYPDGDININMLPTMSGGEYMRLGPEKAYVECTRRVHAHWHHLQTTFPEFQRFKLIWVAPMLGVRETWRVVGEYVLTEHDLLLGLSGQDHPDIVAIADHAMDRHSEGGFCAEVCEPYGIPYRCQIPKGFQNLLVACRAAGFSSLAASSCRLSRTMMQLGQAAGTAAVLAKTLDIHVSDVPPAKLRASLRDQHVQLD